MLFNDEPLREVLLGDCLLRLQELPEATFDVVVTSPPYNLGISYGLYQDSKPRDQYLHWMSDVAKSIKRVMKHDASLFLNVGSSNVDPWISFDVADVFRREFQLQNHIVWVKSISIGDDTVGHFKPINSDRFLNHTHEAIFHLTKNGRIPLDRLAIGVPFKDKSNVARRGHAQDRRCGGNVWFIPYETVRSKGQKFNHPAGFPVELARRCLHLHGVNPETRVLDPFAGAGTTLVAAAGLGCAATGIELDPKYVEIALARLRASEGQ